MTENNVIALAGREAGGDELTELLRNGARTLIAQALEAEVAQLLERFQDHRDEMGRARVVRNGHLPERNIQTGIGPVPVKRAKVRDRGADDGEGGEDGEGEAEEPRARRKSRISSP